MRTWLPYPLLTAVLLGIWLLLAQSVSPGQLLLGSVAAILAARAMAALRPERPTLGRLRPAFRLAGFVLQDIVRSNLAVAGLVLFPRPRRSGFILVPLDLHDRHGLAMLALILTATPGTSWVDLDSRKRTLLIHVLDLVDEDALIAQIKSRYEAPLLEVFQS